MVNEDRQANRTHVLITFPGMDGVSMNGWINHEWGGPYNGGVDTLPLTPTSIDIEGDAPILHGDGTILNEMRRVYRVPVRIAAIPESEGEVKTNWATGPEDVIRSSLR